MGQRAWVRSLTIGSLAFSEFFIFAACGLLLWAQSSSAGGQRRHNTAGHDALVVDDAGIYVAPHLGGHLHSLPSLSSQHLDQSSERIMHYVRCHAPTRSPQP